MTEIPETPGDEFAPSDYSALATRLASLWASRPPGFVGLGGGQGAGKSTLARLIEAACAKEEIRLAVLGLDDFYFSKSKRRELAASIHPLFETRGPPGTHDIVRCRETIERLRQAAEVEVPVFDKGLDDLGSSRRMSGPYDIVLLEGWCVGAAASPAADLERPINRLERIRDPDGVWRRAANDHLAGPYAETWRSLDSLVYLQVPDLAAVRRWRLQQEASRPVEQRLGRAAVEEFVEYYERITLAMLADLPDRADVTIRLADDHSIAETRIASAIG